MFATIGKRFTFEAAHQIPWHKNPDGTPGKCANLHGHSYHGIAYLRGAVDAQGWVKDFHEMGRDLKNVEDLYDHSFLNERPPFNGLVQDRPFWPTTEHVAEHVLVELLSLDDRYIRVVITETDSSEVIVEVGDL